MSPGFSGVAKVWQTVGERSAAHPAATDASAPHQPADGPQQAGISGFCRHVVSLDQPPEVERLPDGRAVVEVQRLRGGLILATLADGQQVVVEPDGSIIAVPRRETDPTAPR